MLVSELRPMVKPRFGAHMSIAGGLHLAFERGAAVGCDCLQVFVKNQRQWSAPPLTDEAVTQWSEARQKYELEPVIAHDTYLINLAAPDETIWEKSVNAFADELERCEALGIKGLVTHPGSHLGQGEASGIRRIAKAINAVHRRTRGYAVRTLLETTAGQGTNIGHRFEHLAEIVRRVRQPERIGVCVDTCHIFSAGYDLITDDGYASTFEELDQVIGLDRIVCFHLNDSRKPLGSRVDRHELIGQGKIGRKAFKRLVNDPRFARLPMILETPKGEDSRGRDNDRVTIQKLRRMAAKHSDGD